MRGDMRRVSPAHVVPKSKTRTKNQKVDLGFHYFCKSKSYPKMNHAAHEESDSLSYNVVTLSMASVQEGLISWALVLVALDNMELFNATPLT